MSGISVKMGVQAADSRWLLRMVLDAEDVTVTWTSHAIYAWRGSEREAKAVSSLVPVENGHPLRVRKVQ